MRLLFLSIFPVRGQSSISLPGWGWAPGSGSAGLGISKRGREKDLVTAYAHLGSQGLQSMPLSML